MSNLFTESFKAKMNKVISTQIEDLLLVHGYQIIPLLKLIVRIFNNDYLKDCAPIFENTNYSCLINSQHLIEELKSYQYLRKDEVHRDMLKIYHDWNHAHPDFKNLNLRRSMIDLRITMMKSIVATHMNKIEQKTRMAFTRYYDLDKKYFTIQKPKQTVFCKDCNCEHDIESLPSVPETPNPPPSPALSSDSNPSSHAETNSISI